MNLNRILLLLLAAVWAATVAFGSTSTDNAARVATNTAGRDKVAEVKRSDAAASAARPTPKAPKPGAK